MQQYLAKFIQHLEGERNLSPYTVRNYRTDLAPFFQFVEAEDHGIPFVYYVRFSDPQEETLLRVYFPNPYLADDFQRTELQPEKLRAFEEFRDRYLGREGIVFVERPRQTSD